ncbi:hypothetical protein FACS189428_1160 [Clostridia bacterium]|nr:hypothetical protein FACS189428_1160 [Clostridia bacterium]
MQRIEIKHFGPIEDLQLDIKDFMLFIGPQASGKSTIAKTIFFFKSLQNDWVDFLRETIEKNDFSNSMETFTKNIRKKFFEYFGLNNPNDLYLKYSYNSLLHITITSREQGYVNAVFSEQFEIFTKHFVKECEDFKNSLTIETDSRSMSTKAFLKYSTQINEFVRYLTASSNSIFEESREMIFIPAGRSLLATLTDQLQVIEQQKLDVLMRSFVKKINILKPLFKQSLSEMVKARELLTQSEIDFEKTKIAEEIIQRILQGKYQYDNDGEKIYYENGKYVRLNYSSSGQQESLWILLLLFVVILQQQNVFIVIEEPEAHLFPEAQKEISALIALVSNMKQSQVIITTHSPYILASINNLILADKVGTIAPAEVSKKVNQQVWINRDKVYAALVEQGKVSDIIDKDWNLIQQEQIDTVSRQINEEFDFLYQYEPEDGENM